MKKLKKALLIILVLLFLVGMVCITVSAFLGAHPQEIALAIFRQIAAFIGINRLGFTPQL